MPAPTLLVEFGYNKSGTDYVWNDISAYVRNVSISRGTSREIDAYSAGSATVILSNNDRRFDPTNTSSPYYSAGVTQIQPAGAIRITSGSGAGLVQFYGFIDNWTFDYPNQGFDGTATVMAYDGLSNLAKAILSTTYNSAQYTGNRIQYILNRTEVYWNSALTDLDGGNSTVYGDTILATDNVTVLTYLQQVAKSEPGDFFMSRDGKATFRDRRYLTDSWASSTTRYNFCKNPNFEVSTVNWTGGNGLSLSTAQKYLGTQSLLTNYDGISSYTFYYTETDATKYVAGQSYIASSYVYTATASNTTIDISFYNGASLLTSVQQTVVLGAATWTRIDTGTAVAPATTNKIILSVFKGLVGGQIYIDAVQIEPVATLADYFDGTFVPANDGTKRYTSRWTALAGISSSTLEVSALKTTPTILTPINFSDYSGSDIPYTNVKVTYNSENLFNRITLAKTVAPVAVVKEDTTLQDKYGMRTYGATDYLNQTDAELTGIAGELLSVYGKPELRVEQMDIQLHGLSGANQTIVLGMDMRQLIQITFKPSRTGSQMIKKYVVIGISQNIDKAKTHTMTLTVASIDNLPFHLNSAMLGVLDTNVLSY